MGLEHVRQVVFPKEGARKKYDLISDRYHRKIGILEIKPNMEALNLIKITKGEKILDVGFGTGWVLEKILSMGATGEVHGIDFARGMHRVARERLKRKQLESRAILIQGDILSMPYKDESFEVVFASFILDILETANIQKLLLEVKRVLKPHGRIVIVAMTKDGKGLLKITRCFYDCFYPFWPTAFGYRPSSRPIFVVKEIKKAGFSITEEKLTHSFFYFPIKIVIGSKT